MSMLIFVLAVLCVHFPVGFTILHCWVIRPSQPTVNPSVYDGVFLVSGSCEYF